MPSADDEPLRFVALLGASNLTWSLPQAVAATLARVPRRPLDLRVAHGPGRSYVVEAGVLGIRWPGLARCGLTEALEAERRADRPGGAALVTDVGNDIAYGTGVERVLAEVEGLCRRLRAAGARVGITSLPLEPLARVPPFRFAVLRRVYFPFRPLGRSDALRRAEGLQRGLEELCASGAAVLLPTREAWYGLDGIHLRARARDEAFGHWLDDLLGAACAGAGDTASDARPGPRLRGIRRVRPRVDSVLGFRRVRGDGAGTEIAPGVRLQAY